ncbi:hypothetical protein [Pseudoxanthomonas sp. JBR18]|uniref:hypothetical protein n=1 Tax=Pseudoxanthomonas sp. JBR18 TaxID=2969308 RepID=UPI0023053D19|nr:hypothetical protein [Pseudoxanthomonas sp. JBR18]WCE05833.1 hypothetical protein PJ250_07760 [Pseudoxanthomonas sp. JBR18]
MKISTRIVLLVVLLGVPQLALASDFRGVLTLFIFLPLLVVANILAGVLMLSQRCRIFTASRWISILLFFPFAALSAAVFFVDAMPTLLDWNMADLRDPNDHAIAFVVGYFFLIASLSIMSVKLAKRPRKLKSGDS